MTREEAIKIISQMIKDEEGFLSDNTVEAHKMAIKALEQEPCEDAISRQAVLAIAGDSCLDLDSYEDTKEFCDEIKELPPVTPKPKTGRWILNDNQGVLPAGYRIYHCSECGREISSKYHGKLSLITEYPFCHCGCRMG